MRRERKRRKVDPETVINEEGWRETVDIKESNRAERKRQKKRGK